MLTKARAGGRTGALINARGVAVFVPGLERIEDASTGGCSHKDNDHATAVRLNERRGRLIGPAKATDSKVLHRLLRRLLVRGAECDCARRVGGQILAHGHIQA